VIETRAGGVGSGWWVAAVGGGDESDGAVLVLFDSVSAAVNDDVVVVPAQGDEVVGMVGAAVAAGDYVVGLEAVTGGAAGCPTGPVPPSHIVPDRRWDLGGSVAGDDGSAVL